MIDKRVYFLSGLPRTGSTLLGSILSQNPDIHVTPTSPLYSLLVATNEHFNRLSVQYTYDHEATSRRVYHAMISAFYQHISEPVVFDKNRGWPKHIPAITEYLNHDPKIICTVRPIAEIITSYLVLADKDPNNFIDTHLKSIDRPINSEERATLLWTTYLKSPWECLLAGLNTDRDRLMLVQYRDLVYYPTHIIKAIYDFCGLDAIDHGYNAIENKCSEAKDEAWGLKGLHEIRPHIGYESRSPREYLPADAIRYFETFDELVK